MLQFLKEGWSLRRPLEDGAGSGPTDRLIEQQGIHERTKHLSGRRLLPDFDRTIETTAMCVACAIARTETAGSLTMLSMVPAGASVKART